MSAEQNKAVVRRLIQGAFNDHHPDVIDELVAPEFVGMGEGPEGLRQLTAKWLKAFPDLQQSIEAIVAEGDLVAVRSRVTATHTGEFPTSIFGTIPPTGKEIDVTETAFLRVADGKIVEWRSDLDHLGLYQQLGVVGSGPGPQAL